jgi:hypothetical protein
VLRPAQEFTYKADSPRSVWERLSIFFESDPNLRTHLAHHAGFEPSSLQAAHIAAALRQGREWFLASTQGELMTRPVAVYYGMVSFASAVTMSYARPKLLDQFKKGHGLAFDGLGNLQSASVQTSGRGFLFQNFSDIALAQSQVAAKLRQGSLHLAINDGETDPIPPVTLKQLFARIPRLADYFRQTFGEDPAFAPVRLYLTRLGQDPSDRPLATIVLEEHHRDFDAARERIPALRRWRAWQEAEDRLAFENLPPDLMPRPSTADEQRRAAQSLTPLLPQFYATPFGAILAAPLSGCKIPLPEASVMMAAAFLLSAVARYRPDVWASFLVMRGSDTKLRAIVEEFLGLCEDQFPLIALGLLMRGMVRVTPRQPVFG